MLCFVQFKSAQNEFERALKNIQTLWSFSLKAYDILESAMISISLQNRLLTRGTFFRLRIVTLRWSCSAFCGFKSHELVFGGFTALRRKTNLKKKFNDFCCIDGRKVVEREVIEGRTSWQSSEPMKSEFNWRLLERHTIGALVYFLIELI